MLCGNHKVGTRYIHAKEVFQMEGYCLKCRTKREMSNAVKVTLKNGRPATQGTCPVCGTKITRIGKSE
jgi:RNase P subunit RPR2